VSSPRRLLVLSHFFPPLAGGGVHRVLGFTRYLPRHGWRCTVVCAGREDYWVTDESLEARVHPETEVVRVSGGSALAAWLRMRAGDRGRRSGSTFAGLRALSSWWLLPDSYAGWSRRAGREAARLLEDATFDAVLSTSPPDSIHEAARRLRRAGGPPWVADFRDPWMGLHLRTPPTRWHRARQAAMERGVMNSADVILVASQLHGEWIERDYGEPIAQRVVHLPNGFEPSGDTPATRAEADAIAESDADRFVMVFTGTLALMPDAMTFLDALHELLERRPEARRRVRVHLVGPYEADYEDRALALGLSGIVRFEGAQSHARARAYQSRADLLLLWKPSGAPTMVPGKLYEYLDSARPLVALLDAGAEAARMVASAGGDVVHARDRAGLGAVIERHYLAWHENAARARPRPEWVDQHTRERLAAKLAGVLDRLVATRSTR